MKTRVLALVLAACALRAPRATSQAVLVVETEVGRRWSGGRKELDLSWQAGGLADRGRFAVGATAFAGVGLNVRSDRPLHNSRFGVLPRYRRWLSRSASLDLSAGPVVELRRGAPATLLTTAAVAVGWPNDVAFSGRVEVSEGNHPTWFAGVRFGSHQITEALEAEGIGLLIWGIVTFLEAAGGH